MQPDICPIAHSGVVAPPLLRELVRDEHIARALGFLDGGMQGKVGNEGCRHIFHSAENIAFGGGLVVFLPGKRHADDARKIGDRILRAPKTAGVQRGVARLHERIDVQRPESRMIFRKRARSKRDEISRLRLGRVPIPSLAGTAVRVRAKVPVTHDRPSARYGDDQFARRLLIRLVPRGEPAPVVGRLALRPNFRRDRRITSVRAYKIQTALRLGGISEINHYWSALRSGRSGIDVEPLVRLIQRIPGAPAIYRYGAVAYARAIEREQGRSAAFRNDRDRFVTVD